MNRRGETDISILILIAVFVLTAILFLFGIRVGADSAQKSEQQKAIEAKVGYWDIDATTGDREFVYGVKTKE